MDESYYQIHVSSMKRNNYNKDSNIQMIKPAASQMFNCAWAQQAYSSQLCNDNLDIFKL